MASCVVVLADSMSAGQLIEKLQKISVPISKCQLIEPKSRSQDDKGISVENSVFNLRPVNINTVKLLSPTISRKERQRNMAKWLIPFGFIAGLTFTKMTGLETFSDIGLGTLGEPITGGLLGMASGLMGSYVAAASVTPDENEDITTLRNLNEAGKWLLLIDTPFGIELPWNCLQEVNPVQIMRFSDL